MSQIAASRSSLASADGQFAPSTGGAPHSNWGGALRRLFEEFVAVDVGGCGVMIVFGMLREKIFW
jgi:hypothetical protein